MSSGKNSRASSAGRSSGAGRGAGWQPPARTTPSPSPGPPMAQAKRADDNPVAAALGKRAGGSPAKPASASAAKPAVVTTNAAAAATPAAPTTSPTAAKPTQAAASSPTAAKSAAAAASATHASPTKSVASEKKASPASPAKKTESVKSPAASVKAAEVRSPVVEHDDNNKDGKQNEKFHDKLTIGEYRERNWFVTAADQLWVMLKKNFTLQRRYVNSTLTQVIGAPLVLMLLLFVQQKADDARQKRSFPHPLSYPMTGVLPCQGELVGDKCFTIMFTPNEPEYRDILGSFAARNLERTGKELKVETNVFTELKRPDVSYDIVPVPDTGFIYDYALKFPNTTMFAVSFNKDTAQPKVNYEYQVWYNYSLVANASDPYGPQLQSLMLGLDEAIISVASKSDTKTKITVDLKDWPVIPPKNIGDTVVLSLGAVYFFSAATVIFVTVLNSVVSEKELKLRIAMEMMGLKQGIFWASTFLSNAYLVLGSALFICIFGRIFGFTFFTNCDFGISLITFFLFGLAMLSLAFFLTTLVRKAKVAVLLGIFIFVIGLLFMSFVFSSTYVGYIWWNKDTTPIAAGVLQFIPFFNFGKVFIDISTYTTGQYDVFTDSIVPGDGFNWTVINEPIPEAKRPVYTVGETLELPAPVMSWYLLIMNVFFYMILTWYFDQVVPDEYGKRQQPWFFLLPSYWGFTGSKQNQTAQWIGGVQQKNAEQFSDEDEQVKAERGLAADAGYDAPLRVLNLRKEYRANPLWKSKTDKTAVKSLCLALQEGRCLALLGQNGAGKSTSMNILSGLTPSSAGDALVYGLSVRSQMPQIQKIMGVCPQHDILFGDLTALEHIELYGGLKGLSRAEIHAVAEERLTAVKLWGVRHQRASAYSGGMKRRLSMVISTIGDPKIVYLDEPTTGMDPVNRRHVWSFIEKFKRSRVVIITTHSMEEADVLGDRIAIMAYGRLRALGNSIYLKNRYGAGYRVSVVCEPQDADGIVAWLRGMAPEGAVEDNSAGSITYLIPLAATAKIPQVVRALDMNNDGVVRAWGISQATLEEVFLKLIRDANPGGYGNEKADQVIAAAAPAPAQVESVAPADVVTAKEEPISADDAVPDVAADPVVDES